MPKKVKYKPRKKKKDTPIINREYLNGRSYNDFLNYITEHPYDEVVELDTVEGGKGTNSYIMTLLFRRSNFMMAFKLKDHTAQSITSVFDIIKSKIDVRVYSRIFKIILTDRGTEFTNVSGIENYGTERITRLFFCDARQSQQKGKIEKNHVELRKIFPKGFDFTLINQQELELALNHINSYPRALFNHQTPHAIFKSYALPEALYLNNSRGISYSQLNLTPKLIKI